MLKSLLIGLVALLVLATGATAASPKQKVKNVNRLCVWVESGNNTPDTAWDLKIKKAYTANVKTCIVGKQGKTGKQGKQGKSGAKGATGAQGLMGTPGAQGLMGTPGAQGLQGIAALAGRNGLDGLDGTNGADGLNGAAGAVGEQGEQGEVGLAGPAGPAGPAGANGEDGLDGAAGPAGPAGPIGPAGPAGADGEDGAPGPAGPQGPAGAAGFSGIVGVGGGAATGDKQFTMDCPLNLSTPNNLTDRLRAVSGGFDIQGSVTADYMSDSAGNPAIGNVIGTSWTVVQSSGAALSGTVYVYCLAPVAP